MGAKTFEQAAGFLRIRGAGNLLDASAVHPESYPVVEVMASDLGCAVSDLMTSADLREKIILKNYVSGTTGMPTLTDIMSELAKPGRDPREQFELFTFTEGINEMADLEVGMKLPGVVTNVTAFGAFVDIGVHQDGLVHISALADKFVRNPHDVIKVNQKVAVTVMDVDMNETASRFPCVQIRWSRTIAGTKTLPQGKRNPPADPRDVRQVKKHREIHSPVP